MTDGHTDGWTDNGIPLYPLYNKKYPNTSLKEKEHIKSFILML